MDRKSLVVLLAVVGLWFAGGLLLAGPAGAVTSKTPSVIKNARLQTFIFFLGEDGGIWYTVLDDGGLVVAGVSPFLLDGNSGNPFAGASAAGNGFVSASSLSVACTTVGAICSSIYAKVPSVGTFQDAPVAYFYGTSQQTFYFIVIAPGLDNGLWYLLYDAINNSFGSVGPPGEPYKPTNGTTESGNSGFASSSTLGTACTALGRTCIGLFVRFPGS